MDVDGCRCFIRNKSLYKSLSQWNQSAFFLKSAKVSEVPQQLYLILCVLFLCITVFCSVLNMPYVLGSAVDLAWCLKGFADGQECFILIKKGLQMQEYQFSRKGWRVSSGMEITLLFSRTKAVFNSAQHQLCPLLCLWGAPDPHLGDLSSTWVTFTGGSELFWC